MNTEKTPAAFENDEALVLFAQGGNDEALDLILKKYKNYVTAKARSYFLIGADKEDLVQEGMIGLFKAIRDYNKEKQASFKSFAELCITRQIITAIKTATRQKHMPLNSYISLNKPVYDEESEQTLVDVISRDKSFNPEELFISKEQYASISVKISKILSNFELVVLSSYLEGKSYVEIAEDLGKQVKSIDNALQRVKKKVERCLKES